MNATAMDDNEARLAAFLCSAWMHSGLVYRERVTVIEWSPRWRRSVIGLHARRLRAALVRS